MSLSFPTTCAHSERVAMVQPKEALEDTGPAHTLTLDFSFHTSEKGFLLKPPSLWYFIMAA